MSARTPRSARRTATYPVPIRNQGIVIPVNEVIHVIGAMDSAFAEEQHEFRLVVSGRNDLMEHRHGVGRRMRTDRRPHTL